MVNFVMTTMAPSTPEKPKSLNSMLKKGNDQVYDVHVLTKAITQHDVPINDDDPLDVDEELSENTKSGSTSLSSGLGRLETEKLKKIRIVFSFIIVFAALLFSVGMWKLIRQSERNALERQFQDRATKIFDSLHNAVKRKVGALEALSFSTSSYALSATATDTDYQTFRNASTTQNGPWPFVTIPDFATRGASIRSLGESASITLHPFVTHDNRRQWEAYSSSHAHWVDDGIKFQENWKINHTALYASKIRLQQKKERESIEESLAALANGIHAEHNEAAESSNPNPHDFIFNIDNQGDHVPARLHDFYFPLWQSSPVAPNLVNFDLASKSEFRRGIVALRESQRAIFVNVADQKSKVRETFQENWAQIGNTQSFEAHPDEPISMLFFPIFDHLKILNEGSQNDNVRIVGMYKAVFYFRTYLIGALPPQTPPMTAVFHSTCGDDHTFKMKDGEVHYVGMGNKHNRRLSGAAHDMSSLIFDFEGFDESIHSYGGILPKDICDSTLTIYSTKEMENEHFTNRAWVMASTILGIFLFTCSAVAIYDYKVEQRQKVVARHATKANAIVSSIFPKRVQKRLFQGIEIGSAENSFRWAQRRLSNAMPSALDAQKTRIKNFLAQDPKKCQTNDAGANDAGANDAGAEDAGPIANTQVQASPPPAGSVHINMEHTFRPAIVENAIVDHFTNVTIMFGDIVGFTPWSSQREPSEIFTLLQNLYHAFDGLAKRLKVFKVETVGDCYVAATGLPNPQHDHAVRMARFAGMCMRLMTEITRDLEVTLGPDTGELKMRVGLHTGPITAGVLRGSKSRFQLFGDTMNMAARMESNSLPSKIQCSVTTAEELHMAGKQSWTHARKDVVEAKGKGRVETFWVYPRYDDDMNDGDDINTDDFSECSDPEAGIYDTDDADVDGPLSEGHHETYRKHSLTLNQHYENPGIWDCVQNSDLFDLASHNNRYQRLIDWNVALLTGFLRQIAAKRIDWEKCKAGKRSKKIGSSPPAPLIRLTAGSTALDEVTEIIVLPQEMNVEVYNDSDEKKTKWGQRGTVKQTKTNPDNIQLGESVCTQLKDYVTTIASMYRKNPFHNFEHASHVTMCTNKLLKRVTVRDQDNEVTIETDRDLHDYTFGIRSDPLTQFALVFCALIHDVDHAGVSNFQLMNENALIAKLYKNKSIAEQNSVDLAWDLLMDPSYADLQKAIYNDVSEMKRFRQLVVNIVLATDIFDKDMKAIREKRWAKAFQYSQEDEDVQEEKNDPIKISNSPRQRLHKTLSKIKSPLSQIDGANLKATIVMEHLIQASDVAHTMQHWEIYLKWNERLFMEMLMAYDAGRAAKDPSKCWYEGEIMFFDKYIIPLAKKLDECHVFGVSSDECLNYAKQNRKMWAYQGDQIIQDFINRYQQQKEAAAAADRVVPYIRRSISKDKPVSYLHHNNDKREQSTEEKV